MAVYGEKGFDRSIHNIENAPFRTKFDKDVNEMKGYMGIGCISDYEPPDDQKKTGGRVDQTIQDQSTPDKTTQEGDLN